MNVLSDLTDLIDTLQPRHLLLAATTLMVLSLYVIFKLDRNPDPRGLLRMISDYLTGLLQSLWQELENFAFYLVGHAQQAGLTYFDEAAFDQAISKAIKAAILIALVSFLGTYRATANYALEHGFGFASYGVPVVIDLFTVLLGYVIYAYSMAGIQKPPPLTIGLFTMAALSTYINIQHARQVNSTVSVAITLLGAIFPVILAFTIELISTMNRLRLKRSTLLKTDQKLVQEIEAKRQTLVQLDTKIGQAQETLSEIIVRQTAHPKRKKQSSSEDKNGASTTRKKVKDLQLAGRTASEIAQLLQVSKSLVYTYLREEEPADLKITSA